MEVLYNGHTQRTDMFVLAYQPYTTFKCLAVNVLLGLRFGLLPPNCEFMFD